jgi:hypothetical protein
LPGVHADHADEEQRLRGHGQRQADEQRSGDQFIRHEVEETEDRRGRRHRADAKRVEEVEDETDEHFEDGRCPSPGIVRPYPPEGQEPANGQQQAAERERRGRAAG